MPKCTNTPIPSAFNVAAIMRRAWELYRNRMPEGFGFRRRLFGHALRNAWQEARIFRQCAEERAQRAAMSTQERRVADLQSEIAYLDHLPLQQRIGDRRATLNAELATLRKAA